MGMSPYLPRGVCARNRGTERKVRLGFLIIAAVCLFQIMQSYRQPKKTLRCCRTGLPSEGCVHCPPRPALTCNNCSAPFGSRNTEDRRAEDIFPYGYLFNVLNVCPGSALRYLVAVSSEPENLVDRQLSRASIGNFYLPNATVRRLFFMGRPNDSYPVARLKQEQSIYHDLVVGDFLSAPENATLVSILVLKWAMTFCPNAEFVVKLSTSGGVGAKSLRLSYRLLKEFRVDYDLYGSVVPLDGQACMQVSDDGTISYCPGPSYLAGCAYVMTRDVVRPMFYAVADNPILPMEELYVTYLLAQSVGARKADAVIFNGCYINPIGQSKPELGSWLKQKLGIE